MYGRLFNCICVNFDDINPKCDNGKVRRLRSHEIRANGKTTKRLGEFIHNQYLPNSYKGRQPSCISFDLMNWMPVDDNELETDVVVIRIDSAIEWDERLDYVESDKYCEEENNV